MTIASFGGIDAMIEKNVIISVRGEQYFEDIDPDTVELTTEGRMTIADDGEIILEYHETELTGMAGARSTVTYRTADRGLVSMIRSGLVSTAMTFKAHHRAICTYETPYMPFQVGIHCLVVENRLLDGGTLVLDYIIEIRGADVQRTTIRMNVVSLEG